jgi:hypothetical protein
MDPLLCKLSPYLRHTMQSILIKDGKNNHIVWDGSAVTRPTDIVMNQVTPVAQEAPVTSVDPIVDLWQLIASRNFN